MVVGDHELDAMQAAFFEAVKKVPPTRPALAVGKLHPQDLPSPLPVDADCNQNSLRLDHVIHPNLFVTCVQDQIREGLGQPPAGKARKLIVEFLDDRRNRRCRKRMPDKLLGDRLHLPRRNALNIHLRKRRKQRFVRTLIALEQLGGEPSLAVLRDTKLDLSKPRHEPSRIIARPVAESAFRAFALFRAHGFRHLGFEHFLQYVPEQLLEPLPIRQKRLFRYLYASSIFELGHGGLLLWSGSRNNHRTYHDRRTLKARLKILLNLQHTTARSCLPHSTHESPVLLAASNRSGLRPS